MAEKPPSYRSPDEDERRKALLAERAMLASELTALRAARKRRRLAWLAGLALGLLPGPLLGYAGAIAIGLMEPPRTSHDPRHWDCDGVEVDLRADVRNCGFCGAVCPASRPYCDDGDCSCAPGLTSCDDGPCWDLRTSAEHCGSCERQCAPGVSCVGGSCRCPAGMTSCMRRPAEDIVMTCADLETSREDCGRCGNRCPAAAECVGGECRCGAGQTFCSAGETAYGECADLQRDSRHCGACDVGCPDRTTCEGGTCRPW
jgi:hypothetical protein